ncbi:MAG: hypothetical protein ACR2HV_06765 [Acidimicrobiales bacterium]
MTDKQWFADVELSGVASSSYYPFVDLALVRYQPNSLTGLGISPVVKTEGVPLLPRHTLTVTRTDDAVQVTLEGAGPTDPRPNRVDVLLERCQLPPGMDAGAVELTRLEQSGDETPAWARVPGFAASGTLNNPLPPLRLPPEGSGPYRIYVREVEQEQAQSAADSPVAAPSGRSSSTW